MKTHPLRCNAGTAGAYKERMVRGLRAYMDKNGFTRVVVGCSGGIDSALTIALACEAVGPRDVTAITMPSVYSSAGSVTDSQQLCKNLGVTLYECPINSIVTQVSETMGQALGGKPAGLALENLQARARGVILMTYSNLNGNLVLATGNRSEALVGYCTLYGDTCGGLNLIGELYKTQVYAVARQINAQAGRALIPAEILEKAPSAELAPGQKDSDSLPEYEVLDCALSVLADEGARAGDAADYLRSILNPQEYDALLDRVGKLMARSEFKRRQLPPAVGLRDLQGAWA